MIGLPELPEPYFAPMWDLFNESGAVANFHIGSGARREEMEAIRGMRNRPREDTTEARPIPAVPAFTGTASGTSAGWRSTHRRCS